jgi:mannose-6-phosphate isomerase-like protein (cupin superfamily)
MDKPRPQSIPLASIPVTPAAEAVTKVRIARVVTRERCGSNLLLGASWLDPGEETNTWSSSTERDVGADDHWYGPVDETYFIVEGRFELDYASAADGDDDRGVLELQPHDCVYLAPGYHYRLRCTSAEPGFFVYSMTPSPQ